MAEEVTNAGRAVPLAIVWSYVGNASVAFIVMCVTMWSIPDVAAAVDNPTGFAFIYPLLEAGKRWAQAIVAIIALIAFAGCTGCNAAASREMAAFSRDGGLPGSKWLAKVTKPTHPPRNSVFVTCFITVALVCINFGSLVAFNAIISGQLIALNASYALTHACALWARSTGRYRREIGRWNMGPLGVYANIVALFYDLFLVVFLALPPAPTVTADTMNWGPVIFLGSTILAIIYYMVYGRHQFRDPGKEVIG
jgi:choline transport protein